MPVRMRVALVASLCVLWAAAAAAQLPEGPYVAAGGRVTFAGELTATAGQHDPDAYFNYTDYAHDALRTVRLRLLGEWRAAPNVSFLGELRTENQDTIEAAALYVRWRPWRHRAFDVQAGRIPPVIGAFARHAYGRDNLVIGVPLAYQYLTSLRPDAIPATADDLLRMRARGWRPSFPVGSAAVSTGIPLLTASNWATGAEVHGQIGRLDLAGSVTQGPPAAPTAFGGGTHPMFSGRAGVSVVPSLVVGFSAAQGQWIDDSVLSSVPEALRSRNAQTVVGVDAEYSHTRLLVRGEWLRSQFAIPAIAAPQIPSPLVSHAAFLEGRYRWHPRWQTSVRVERLAFGAIRGTLFDEVETPWDAPVNRVEAVMGFRAARNLEIRAGWQHDSRKGGRVRSRSYPALQVLYWF